MADALTALAMILMGTGMAISFFAPKRWALVSIILILLSGVSIGIEKNNILIGLLIGIILSIVVIPSGLLVKYYAKKEELDYQVIVVNRSIDKHTWI